jgi:transmembrane sensor
MSVPDTRISYLFNKYFDKSATAHEVEELFTLLNVSATDEHLTLLLQQAWDSLQADHAIFDDAKSEQILKRILNTAPENDIIEMVPVKKQILWRRYAAIAAIMLLAAAAAFVFLKPTKVMQLAAKVKLHDAMPGGNKAILTLANGTSIILDNAHNGVIAKQGNSLVNKTQNGQLVYNADQTVAAVDVNEMNTVATPRGGQYQVVLPDGTKVWLNAASSVKYPTVFNGKTRSVEMTGEVYFEVAKNPLKPFIVKTNRAEVEVLGTHFNVMAYNDEAVMKTTLLEGSVKVRSGNASKVIKPGEQAIVNDNNELTVTGNIDVDEEIAWKNGLFLFNDADIRSIMRQAARWYDVDVIYQGKTPVKQYTGRISRNVKASELLNMLKYTGLSARIDGRNIFITN